VTDVRHRLEVVDVSAAAAQERLVLDASQAATNPRAALGRDRHGALAYAATRCFAAASCSGVGHPPASSDRKAVSTARGSHA
jgi:hypothetical protein